MKTHSTTGFSYDPDIFDDDTLDSMMSQAQASAHGGHVAETSAVGVLMDLAALVPIPDTPLSEADIAALMEHTWHEMYESEDGKMIRNLPVADQTRLKASFLLPPEPIDPKFAATLIPEGERISLVETETSFAILLGERPVLSGRMGSSRADKMLKFQLAAGICIADILALIVAAIGVVQVLNHRLIAKVGATISAQHGARIITASSAIAAAGHSASDLTKAKTIASVAKSVIGSAVKAASTLMSGMGAVEKAAAWTTAVAGLTLAFATGSASLWVSVLAMTAAFAIFLADTAVAVKSHMTWQAA